MAEDKFERNEELDGILRQVSAQLRGSLGNIYAALERLAPPDLRDEDGAVDRNAAVLCQSFFRIMRLADNLEEGLYPDSSSRSVLKNGDFVKLCRDLTDKAQHPAELLGLKLDFRCHAQSHTILMDSARMERLILNLLSNAFKFTPAGGRVVLEVKIEREQVLLSVSDTGCGIPPELRDTVFDRCRHTDRLDPPPHGLGMGLSICRRIAQEHGGALVLPDTEEGTMVTVSLPNRRSRFVEMNSPDFIYGKTSHTFSRILTELSDALPVEAFTRKYLD